LFFEKRIRIAIWAVSVSVGVSVALIPFLLRFYVPEPPYFIPINQKVNNAIALGLIIALAFPATVEFSNYHWHRQVERNIPRFLRDVAEAVRSGITLPRAIEEASRRDYGPLSKELERVMAMFVLGAGWEEAVMSLSRRIKRSIAARLATILIEANETGGRISEVLDASVELFSSLDDFREEQLNNMRPYLFTIYMAAIIFLVIAYVVLIQFLVPLSAAAKQSAQEAAGMMSTVLDTNYYASVLFWASVIESLFGGFVAGKIGDRSYLSGLRHSVTLSVLTLVFFNLSGV
jgi:flagellar protein FlaJ